MGTIQLQNKMDNAIKQVFDQYNTDPMIDQNSHNLFHLLKEVGMKSTSEN